MIALRSSARGDQGSVSVVAAGVMLVMLVMVLAASDVASVLRARSAAQTAADAAALAAAQEMAFPSDGDPADAAAAYARKNAADLVSCQCDADSMEAVVTVRAGVGSLLLLGGTRTVTSRARAVVELPDAAA